MRKLCLQLGGLSQVRFTLLAGVASGTSAAVGIPNGQKIHLTCVYDDGVSAGEVVLESADTEEYAGTWTEEGNSVAADDTTDRITADGGANWWRARVSTPIVGGTVKVYLKALGEY
jgi:hypothetical protein